MNRILTAAAGGVLGAAGALGAAALLAAAPAQAFPGCVPDIACDVIDEAAALPGNVAAQPGQFLESINPATLTNEFLFGNCEDFDAGDCPEADAHPGLVNQPAEFARNLAGQPGRFLESANPVNQLNQFSTNLAGQPQRFADSISRSIGAFGPDVGTGGDDGPGGTGG